MNGRRVVSLRFFQGGDAMEIYLMQHGQALPKDQDLEEGLAPEGEATIHASGKALKKLGVSFDAIVCSPKKRSRQTAAIVAAEVGFPKDKIVETKKVKAMAPPEETVQVLSELSGAKRVLVAGHLPSVGAVVSFLLTESPKITVQYEMGGCCRVDAEDLFSHAGRLRWHLLPEHFRPIAG